TGLGSRRSSRSASTRSASGTRAPSAGRPEIPGNGRAPAAYHGAPHEVPRMSPLRFPSVPRFAALLSVLLALNVSGCIIHIGSDGDWDPASRHSPVLQGSGVRGTQQRSPGEFERVRASTMGDVHVVVGAAPRVEVSCDDNLLDHIRTRVVDGELILEGDGESM